MRKWSMLQREQEVVKFDGNTASMALTAIVLSYPFLRQDVSVVGSCLLISDAVEVEKQLVQKGEVVVVVVVRNGGTQLVVVVVDDGINLTAIAIHGGG
eukprot:5315298-Pleurochrysis_carterae.AAC.1